MEESNGTRSEWETAHRYAVWLSSLKKIPSREKLIAEYQLIRDQVEKEHQEK
jgi:hypothetical protein